MIVKTSNCLCILVILVIWDFLAIKYVSHDIKWVYILLLLMLHIFCWIISFINMFLYDILNQSIRIKSKAIIVLSNDTCIFSDEFIRKYSISSTNNEKYCLVWYHTLLNDKSLVCYIFKIQVICKTVKCATIKKLDFDIKTYFNPRIEQCFEPTLPSLFLVHCIAWYEIYACRTLALNFLRITISMHVPLSLCPIKISK